jgi:chemotaxis protein CheX
VDTSYIVAYVKSIQNVFETMLRLPVQVGSPGLKAQGNPQYDVSGIIGMSGDVEGTVVLSFPTATAERVVTLFTGAEISAKHEDFADAVGELVNMISGGAKAQFTGKTVSISCPSIIIGTDHVVFNRKDVTTVSIPCTCDCGEFAVEVSIKQAAQAVIRAAG